MSKRDILLFLFKWKGTIFGWFLFVVLATTVLVYSMDRTYVAQARVLIEYDRTPTAAAAPRVDTVVVMNSEAEVAVSRPVIEAVIDSLRLHEVVSEEVEEPGLLSRLTGAVRGSLATLGLVDPPMSMREAWVTSLQNRLNARPEVSSAILTLTLADNDPDRAAVLLNAVLQQYVERRPAVFAAQGAARFYRAPTSTSIVEPAYPPEKPAVARLPLIIVGVFGGLVIAIGVALLREYFDKRVQTPEAAEAVLPDVPSLGSIGRLRPGRI